jgi:PAS domain S-box-containing protein
MSIDTGREGIDEKRPLRHGVERLAPAAKPGELSAPSASAESTDQSTPRVNDVSRSTGVSVEQAPPSGPMLPAWLGRLGYYGLALVFVALAAGLRWAMPQVLSSAPFLVFYLAWVGAAAFGGLGPGLLATVASWLCIDLLFDYTIGRIDFADWTAVDRLLVFLIGGLVVSIVGEKMRRSRILRRRQTRELAQLARSLEREKEVLQSVMNGAKNSHLVYLDREFNFVRVNETYARSCGYAPQEMIGKNHFVLYPHAENEAIFSRVRDTGGPVEFRDRPFVFPDQPERGVTYWDWTLTPVTNDSGQVEGLVFSLFETTQRKQAEETLRERMKELTCLYAVSRDMQNDCSLDELCRRAVEHLASALQFPDITVPVLELNGKRFTPDNCAEGLSHGLHAPIRVDGEILGDLRVLYTQERPFLIPEEQDLVNGIAEAFSTWLERQRAEEALRESEARFRILTTNLSAGVALIDEEGKFALYNPAFLTMFGLTEHSSIRNVNDQNWGDWQVFEPDGMLLPVADHPVRKTALTGQAVRNKLVGVRLPSGGDLRWMLVSAEPIPRADGRRAIICTYHDVTERKRAEDALRELNATLESKVAQRTAELEQRARQLQKLTLELTKAEERERQRLAEILHDDLQQVLAAARFHLSVLHGRVKDDAGAQGIAAQVRDLLGDAIGKSRGLSHELSSPALAQGDVAGAFESLAEQMQTRHGLTVRLDLCERVLLSSEPLRVLLYRAAQELLFNVIKHAGVREATLRLRRRRGRLCLSVSDQGQGFDPRQLGKAGGFGLLSIRERTELLGGRMKIRSAKGKGSIFLIAVPDAEV